MPHVRTERGTIWRIVLARPEQRNALSEGMLGDLAAALEEAAAASEARVIVLTGEGPDFCAGADLADIQAAAEAGEGAYADTYGQALDRALDAIASHPLPVVAAVQGAALGGGCQLAVAADLTLAAADARLGLPLLRLGVVVSYPNVVRLTASVGWKRASAMLLAGRVISGEEAAAWGLVSEAVPRADLTARAETVAGQIAAGAPISVRAAKRGLQAALEQSEGDRGVFEMMLAQAFASEDLREGIRAFRERRAPRFEGR